MRQGPGVLYPPFGGVHADAASNNQYVLACAVATIDDSLHFSRPLQNAKADDAVLKTLEHKTLADSLAELRILDGVQ